MFAFGEAYMKIGTKRLGDIFTEELTDGLARSPTNDFAHEEPIGHRVIAMLFAGRPPGLGRRKRHAHSIPVIKCFRGQRFADGRKSYLMTEQPADRDVLFSGSGEFRPILGHWRIEVDQALLDETMGD